MAALCTLLLSLVFVCVFAAACPCGFRTTLDAPASWIWDNLAPGASLPFAWDDITAKHVVEVEAAVLAPGGRTADDGQLRHSRRNTYAFEIDTLQVWPQGSSRITTITTACHQETTPQQHNKQSIHSAQQES